jgi:hypothetical protein
VCTTELAAERSRADGAEGEAAAEKSRAQCAQANADAYAAEVAMVREGGEDSLIIFISETLLF